MSLHWSDMALRWSNVALYWSIIALYRSNMALHPKLERGSTVLLLLLLCTYVCHAQGTPPEFRNGLDWRALVED